MLEDVSDKFKKKNYKFKLFLQCIFKYGTVAFEVLVSML